MPFGAKSGDYCSESFKKLLAKSVGFVLRLCSVEPQGRSDGDRELSSVEYSCGNEFKANFAERGKKWQG